MIDVSTIQTSLVLGQKLTVFISLYETLYLMMTSPPTQLSYKNRKQLGVMDHNLWYTCSLTVWVLTLHMFWLRLDVWCAIKICVDLLIKCQSSLFSSISFLIYRSYLTFNKNLVRMRAINEINYLSFCLFDWLFCLILVLKFPSVLCLSHCWW